ncbi:hypothetical protein [Flavobacterium sp. 2]|uniref:hypothetical protein n=1 Tax=Flavobacterium sp. 2 TaxID=308053 RepID=UPI003CECD3FA
MKTKLLLLICMLFINHANAQTVPPPKNIFVSSMSIFGQIDDDSTVFIDLGDGSKLISVKADANKFFKYESPTLFKVGSTINIYSKNTIGTESVKVPKKVLSPDELKLEYETKKESANQTILLLETEKKKIEEENEKKEKARIEQLATELKKSGYKVEKVNDDVVSFSEAVSKVEAYKAEKLALRNTTLIYGSQILSTNFTIPLVRFNFVEGDSQKQGDILLFTSIGAGVGYYWGQLERTRDNTGEIINEEFRNRFGINLGFLFSAGTGEESKNVFAPVINFAVLDFQIGIGTELGTRSANQKRQFLTLSYAIPVYKLFKKGYKIYAMEPEPNEMIQKSLN